MAGRIRRSAWCALLVGLWLLAGCEGFPFRSAPVVYQEVGVILLQDRLVPAEIRLTGDDPARLHILKGYGATSTEVAIPTLELAAVTVPGVDAVIVIERSQLSLLDGQKLTSVSDGISAQFIVGDGPAEPPAAGDGYVDIAVVMTDDLAAPREVTLMRGVPVRLHVAKTDSDVGFDDLQCDRLGIRVRVPDRQVKTVTWTPEETGTFVFMGTVTPDSRVNVVVVDGPVAR